MRLSNAVITKQYRNHNLTWDDKRYLAEYYSAGNRWLPTDSEMLVAFRQNVAIIVAEHLLSSKKTMGLWRVGTIAIPLAKARGAYAWAVMTLSKSDEVHKRGTHKKISRATDLTAAPGASSADVVVGLVAGKNWPQ